MCMNTGIPKAIIDQIRQETDIVDIIGEYVQLKKQGRNYFGLCPFHDEKSPSFSVTKEKQIFHCFGCGKGGNIYTFLMEIEGFSFFDALKYLSERTGIQLPKTREVKTALSEEANIILSAYEWLGKYYYHLLKYSEEGKKALEYVIDRGINENTVDQFQLGFSPINSDVTVQFLQQKGFHEQLLVKAGLLTERDGNLTDPFRGRVIFPIRNHLGRIVAFGGRAIVDEKPKYLNSPENELFRKGSLIFNFDLAKNEIRKENKVIIFEGYMDVLTSVQAGIKNVVATLGTALTNNQAKLLRRYVDTVILCFDTDEAGLSGTYHAANVLRQNGCDVKVAYIKDQLDPDDFIKRFGREQFEREVIDVSDTFFKFFMNFKKRDYNLSVDSEKIAYIELLVKQLATMPSPIEIEYYVNDIAKEFELSPESILKDVEQQKKLNNNQIIKDKSGKNSNTNSKHMYYSTSKILPAYQNAEKALIAHMLKNNEIIEKVQGRLGIDFNVEEHRIILIHLYALYEEMNDIDISALMDKLEENHLKQLVSELTILQVNEEISNEELDDYINIIQMEANDISYLRQLKEKQKQLEKEKDALAAAKIGLEIIDLEKKIKNM